MVATIIFREWPVTVTAKRQESPGRPGTLFQNPSKTDVAPLHNLSLFSKKIIPAQPSDGSILAEAGPFLGVKEVTGFWHTLFADGKASKNF